MHEFTHSTYYEAVSNCTVLRLECVYREQKFYAQTRIADEYMSNLPILGQQHLVNMEWLKLEKQLTQAMVQFDIENPLPKAESAKLVPKEGLEIWEYDKKYFTSLINQAYQEKIKQQLSKSSYHYTKPAADFYKPPPVDTYRQKAASEFEGVEDLDPELWNEDGDLA